MMKDPYDYVVGKFLRIYKEPSEENLEAFLSMVYDYCSYSYYCLCYYALKRFCGEKGLPWNIKRKEGVAVSKPLPDVVSKEEILKMINGLKSLRDRALIALLYLTGRRVSELISVRTGDLKFETVDGERVLTVKVKVLKRKDHPIIEIPIPLSEALMKPVLQYLQSLKVHDDAKPLFNVSRQRVWQIVKRIRRDLRPHWFRHTRLTHLSSVMNPYELADFAKWKSVELAIKYVHSSKAKLLEKIKMV